MAEEKEEVQKLKTIWEYLVSDRFNDVVDFDRFVKCFEILFKNEKISLQNIFDFIVGVFKNNRKRKYISYTRLYKAYLMYKKKNTNEEINIFFDKLLNSILKLDSGINYLGENKGYSFFSSMFLDNKSFSLTRIVVLKNRENDNIIGLRMEYNDNNQNIIMYNKDNVNIVLDLELKELKDNQNIKNVIRDGITHIFGTFNKIITSIGFKCISGKIIHYGNPDGKSFLFGEYGKKLQCLDLEIDENGISGLKIYFVKNIYVNLCIEIKEDNEDEIYYDEKILLEVQDPDKNEDIRKTRIINLEKDDNEENKIIEEDINIKPNLVEEIDNNEDIKSTVIIGDKTYSINENPFFEFNKNIGIKTPNPFFPEVIDKKEKDFSFNKTKNKSIKIFSLFSSINNPNINKRKTKTVIGISKKNEIEINRKNEIKKKFELKENIVEEKEDYKNEEEEDKINNEQKREASPYKSDEYNIQNEEPKKELKDSRIDNENEIDKDE